MEMDEVCTHADETTFHACVLDLKNLITRLEHDAALVAMNGLNQTT